GKHGRGGSALAGRASHPPSGSTQPLGGAARQKERGHCQVQRGRKSASSTRTVGSRRGIALVGRTRHLLYRSPPNSASSPTRLSPPVSGGETRANRSALAGEASPPPRGLSRVVGRRGAAERTWTLPGEARAEVSQLYPSRVQSVGHSSSGAVKAPAVMGRRPTVLQARRGYRHRSATVKHARTGLLSQVRRRLRRAA
ncbi:MAG TPA: hypothetical protein PLH19_15085, partial [Anaerolineae bacterium]|nr:hypothetical protein [Anaerolineae bacterium]